MSKMSKAVSHINSEKELRLDETVVNYMGGDSYIINPLDTLKMITASSIFGEPKYYDSYSSRYYDVDNCVKHYQVLPEELVGKDTTELMVTAIDNALSYDFKATLDWAVTLRNEYYIRLNPQLIMVRAAIHPNRKDFTSTNPGYFNKINKQVMVRADEPLTQMTYYLLQNNGNKNNIPSVIKRSWSECISNLSRYKIAKYKNHELGMINGIRLCHANSPVIDELMTTGNVSVKEDSKTWENLKSAGKSWKEILNTIALGHMALLRNLRGIFSEPIDDETANKVIEQLKAGVKTGKQFPFRYYSAIKSIKNSDCTHKALLLDALEDCVDIACDNLPHLKGKTMCLSDNSGSAWETFNSEYGSVTVANIDNLSSVITARCSDEGYVGKFGDKLIVHPVTKRNGVLHQAEEISDKGYSDVGGATEGGIWEFFKNAIDKKEHWDNIFIYSDQQAGHGGLYGTSNQSSLYTKLGYSTGWNYINVFKLVLEYRKKVNPKVNVFSIQTAGYNNALLPEYAYRTNIMYGWTGKESVFADAMIKQWDEIDSKQSNSNK